MLSVPCHNDPERSAMRDLRRTDHSQKQTHASSTSHTSRLRGWPWAIAEKQLPTDRSRLANSGAGNHRIFPYYQGEKCTCCTSPISNLGQIKRATQQSKRGVIRTSYGLRAKYKSIDHCISFKGVTNSNEVSMQMVYGTRLSLTG